MSKNMLTSSLVAVFISFVSQEEESPRDMESICEALEIKNRHVVDLAFNRLKPFLPQQSLYLKPKELIERLCHRLGLSLEVLKAAKNVCLNISNYLEGKKPNIVAAVSILATTRLKTVKKP